MRGGSDGEVGGARRKGAGMAAVVSTSKDEALVGGLQWRRR